MKKLVPFLVAAFLFVIGLVLASGLALGHRTEKVVVAAADLPAGHTLAKTDVTVSRVSNPPKGAFTDPNEVVGKALAVPRMAGDVITAAVLGGVPDVTQKLQPNERAVAVKVSLSSGIAGLLKPGDRVGVTMVLNGQGGQTYAKATVEGLRVLYVSPDFQAQPEAASALGAQDDTGVMSGATTTTTMGGAPSQAQTGVVVLAVPTSAQAVVYDFSDLGLPAETREVNAVELLSALDQSGAKLSLYLAPKQAQPMTTGGLLLPDLVVTPGPTPTPNPNATPTPTAQGGQ